ncbi:DUF4221 family protein [Roseivirga sp.]|uniref:DUF4221 family protein n=1 Tax=Roseivirga sp. TaxID=1964215 RepID=UPI003B51998E
MKHTLVITAILGLFIYSCQPTSHEEAEHSFNLIPSGKLVSIELDSVTNFYQQLTFRVDQTTEGEPVISFINYINSSVYIYSATTGDQLVSFQLNREGPQGIGDPVISTLLIHNLDSIFVYSASRASLFLFNREGQLMEKQVIMRFDDDSVPIMPEPIGLNRMIIAGNQIFLPSIFKRRLKSYQGVPSVTRFNLNDKTVHTQYPYPNRYSEAHWGATFKYNTSLAFIPDRQEILVSYPIIDELYAYSLNDPNKSSKHMASSQWIDQFEPFNEDITLGMSNPSPEYWEDMNDYSLKTSDYAGLIFNPFNKTIYRITFVRPTEEEYDSGNKATNLGITAYDLNYNKLAEIKLNNSSYQPSMIAYNQDGLLLARTDLFEENEDVMSLELIQLVKK